MEDRHDEIAASQARAEGQSPAEGESRAYASARKARRMLGRLASGGLSNRLGNRQSSSCFGEFSTSTGGSRTEDATTILRRVLPDIYFVNTPDDRAARHLELLRSLRPPEGASPAAPLLEIRTLPGLPLCECTLCAFDESSPGLLARLCGTMAGLNLSIHTAFIYTLQKEGGQSGEPIGSLQSIPALQTALGAGGLVLDTFLVSESYFGHDRALTAKTQKKLKAELCRALSAGDGAPSAMSRRPLAPLRIHEMKVENRPHEQQTRILLRAQDSFGMLFRATSALAQLGLSIRTAQVSTRDEGADDLFFVVGTDGQKLPDSALSTTEAALRALLQND